MLKHEKIMYSNISDKSPVNDEYIKYVLETYSKSIIRLCYTYVKNISDAEDIAQEVFISLIQRRKPFESNEHEKAWLLRNAINRSKNHLKSGWIRHTVSLENNTVEIENTGSESFTDKNDVLEAVLTLPENYRTVIHMFYYDGYSIKDISRILKKKSATIGTWLSRGRAMLKDQMIGGFDYE